MYINWAIFQQEPWYLSI